MARLWPQSPKCNNRWSNWICLNVKWRFMFFCFFSSLSTIALSLWSLNLAYTLLLLPCWLGLLPPYSRMIMWSNTTTVAIKTENSCIQKCLNCRKQNSSGKNLCSNSVPDKTRNSLLIQQLPVYYASSNVMFNKVSDTWHQYEDYLLKENICCTVSVYGLCVMCVCRALWG